MSDSEFFTLNKPVGIYFDWATFLIAILLIAMGLISVYSATYIYSGTQESGMSIIFIRQVIAALAGLVIMLTIVYLPERWIFFSAYPIYSISILLLILVLLIGKTTAGTKGWISLGGFTIQPSEIAKLGVILAIARRLTEKGSDVRSIRDLAIMLAFAGVPIALIVIQPDFGSSTVIMALIMGVLLWAGFDVFILYFIVCLPLIIIASFVGNVLLAVVVSLVSTIAFFFRRRISTTIAAIGVFVAIGFISPFIYHSLQPHQQARIVSFLNPNLDPQGKGYNVIQSKLAVGSGGLTGKGFLQGTQTQLRYIPKQWTDFIFSVPTEEFGFGGGVAVLVLLFSLIWRGVVIARETDSKFYSLIAIGISTVLLYHAIINVGMAIGLMPVMGIPLPFMSAGGTSLLVNITMVGLLLNIYRNRKLKRYSSN